MNICGLILAAGGSSRLGKPKQLVKVHGKTLLEKAIENAQESSLQHVYVVLGARFCQIAPSVSHLPATIIQNDQWQQGMGSSIRAGIRFIRTEAKYDATLIMLCDQLHISTAHLQSLVDAYLQKKASLIGTEYGAQLGVPALFDQKYFPLLEKLSGDTGAKKILHQFPDELYRIKYEQALIDIDTPEDLEKNGIS